MRCRDAKFWLTVQREDNPAQSEVSTVQEHMRRCGGCRSFEQGQKRLDALLPQRREKIDTPSKSSAVSPYMYSSVSTERIIQAIQQHKRITQQLEDIRAKQQSRMARLHKAGPYLAVVLFALGILPPVLLLVQPQLLAKALTLLSGGIEWFYALGQYVQTELTLVTRNSLLLSGVALVLVVMMGLWLRLMRYPQEA